MIPKILIPKQKIIILLFVFSLVLDVFSNLTLTILGTNFGLVAAGKFIIIIIMLFLIKNKMFLYFFFLLLFSIIMRQNIIVYTSSIITLNSDMIISFRFFAFFLSIALLLEYKDTNVINSLFRILILFCFLQFISIILGFSFKIDIFRAYIWRPGYKGLLYGINDAAFFMVMTLFIGMNLLVKKKKYMFVLLAILSCAILGMGSRGVMLGILLVPISYWFTYSFMNPGVIRKFVFSIFSTLIVITVITVIYINIDVFLSYFMAVSLNVLRGTGSILTAVFSYRDVYAFDYISSLDSPIQLLFGSQYPYVREMIELDMFDFLYRFGIIGTIMYFIPIVIFFKKCKNSDKAVGVAFLLVIFVLGNLMGHVLLSSINAPWIALMLVIYFSRYDVITNLNFRSLSDT